MSNLKYKPTKASKDAEKAVKDPYIEEHNTMGAKFTAGEISLDEWESFLKDWEKRFMNSMDSVVKNRNYEEAEL